MLVACHVSDDGRRRRGDECLLDALGLQRRLEGFELGAQDVLALVAHRPGADGAARRGHVRLPFYLRRQPHGRSQWVVLRVEVGEVYAVLPHRQDRGCVAGLPDGRGQALQPVVEVTEEAGLALLSVTRHVHAGRLLTRHDVPDRRAYVRRKRLFIERLACFLGAHGPHDRGRAHQAAHVRGQDTVSAAPHRDPPSLRAARSRLC